MKHMHRTLWRILTIFEGLWIVNLNFSMCTYEIINRYSIWLTLLDDTTSVFFLSGIAKYSAGVGNMKRLIWVVWSNLAFTLQTRSIDVYCVQQTRIHDSSSVIQIAPPFNASVTFWSALYVRTEVVTSCLDFIDVNMLDWIPVDGRLCAAGLWGSFNANNFRSNRNLLLDMFHQNTHGLLSITNRTPSGR